MRNLNTLITVLALSLAPAAIVGCASSGDDVTDTDADSTAAGKFDLWQSSDGWHFHLKSGNGAILLTSESYTSRTGAITGALSTMTNGVDTGMYSVHQTASGYVVDLKAANGEIISFSQVYSTKSSATRAVNSCVHAITTYLDKVEANTTGARVEIAQGATAQFHFNLHASNGEVVLTSESYTTAAAAWNGAFAVQDAAALASSFTIKTAADGRFYFTVTALNGQVVGSSQMYMTNASATAGIASVKTLLKSLSIF